MSANATREIRPTLDYSDGSSAAPEPVYYGLPLSAWLKVGIVGLLMVLTFRFNLLRLWLKTNPYSGEPNWRHAVCVPVIGLYFLYVHRDDLLAARARHAWSGLGIMLGGILVFVYGIWPGQNDFIKDFGMVVTLFGVVALTCGWDVMRIAWFPIVFLLCAIPWPDLVYSKVASPLQHLAASVAVGTLRYTGVDALNSGTKIMVNGKNGLRTLNVAEACAGLRSLMTFISIGGAVAFLSPRPLWQKIVVVFSAIPIAVFCNVMRVTGMGYIDQWRPEYTEGFAHQFVGMVMLIPGFLLIMLVGLILDQLFIEEADDGASPRNKIVRAKPTAATAWALPRTGINEDRHAQPTKVLTAAAATKALSAAPATAPAIRKPAVSAPTAVSPAAPKPPVTAAAVAKPPAAKPATSAAAAPAIAKPVTSAPKPAAAAIRPPAAPVKAAAAPANTAAPKPLAAPRQPQPASQQQQQPQSQQPHRTPRASEGQ